MQPVISRRSFMKFLGVGSILFSFPKFSWNTETSRDEMPPNIILIMADDLGFGHLGCYGQNKIKTPHIDKLANEGVRFTQAYAGCTVCAPSRSTLMTGLHMGHTPVRGNSGGIPLRKEDVTIAEVLQNAGYATGGYGKWGLGEAGTAGVPTKQGFDEFVGYLHQIHAHFYYPEYLWKNEMKWPLPGNQAGGRWPANQRGIRDQYAPDEIMKHALNFIRSNQDRPFFCYIPTIIPHVELAVPDESLEQYQGEFEETWFNDPRPGYADSPNPRATYAAMVTHMDKNVGQVMSVLKELGIDERTLVIFTSDNGAQGQFGGGGGEFFEFFNPTAGLRGRKGSMYEGGLRVPLIARWPGRITPGTVNDNLPIYFPDMMPTFADIAETAAPENIDGISFLPALIGAEAAERKQELHEFLYWDYGSGSNLRQAARMGKWKAVRNTPDEDIELYDLYNDPQETSNIAENHPDIIKEISSILSNSRETPYPQIEPIKVKNKRYR